MHGPRVYINGISEDSLQAEVEKGLEFVGAGGIIDGSSTIFIKPNLTDIVHKPGITTTPAMIKAVLTALSPMVKKVYIGESDGGNFAFSANNSLMNHNVYHYAKAFKNVEVVNLSKLPRRRVAGDVNGQAVWVDLPDLLLNDINCLVSVPVLKAHAMTHGTFSIKNLWGCYPDPQRNLHHKYLDQKLSLINSLTRNRIQIIDGFWALDGHGPMEGTPVRTNKILVGNDVVAVDSAAAYIMGLDTRKITHLGVAEEYGLGTSDASKITYNTDLTGHKLQKFKPYKIKLDYLNALLFNSEFLAKVVLDSPLTPMIYSTVNLTRTKDQKTNCAAVNRKCYEQRVH